MRSLAIYGLGFFFLCVGAGLFALSWRKPQPRSGVAKKSELREEAALQAEAKKLRLAAGITAGLGVLLILIS